VTNLPSSKKKQPNNSVRSAILSHTAKNLSTRFSMLSSLILLPINFNPTLGFPQHK